MQDLHAPKVLSTQDCCIDFTVVALFEISSRGGGEDVIVL